MANFPGFVNEQMGPTVSSAVSDNFIVLIVLKGKTDAWWLHQAMVRKEFQRQGVAKALIEVVLNKVRAQGTSLFSSGLSGPWQGKGEG
jgi:GNAT superfamily N-acetyltransferase